MSICHTSQPWRTLDPAADRYGTLTGTLEAAREIGVRFQLRRGTFRLFALPTGVITAETLTARNLRGMVKTVRPLLVLRLHLDRVMPNKLFAFDEHFVTVASASQRSADRTMHTKPLDASTLACWFWYHAQHLPREPFDLGRGERVVDPVRLYQTAADRLQALEWGCTLRADLDRLRALYDRFGMDTLTAAEAQSEATQLDTIDGLQ